MLTFQQYDVVVLFLFCRSLIAKDERIPLVSFTGSTKVSRIVINIQVVLQDYLQSYM